MKKLLNLLIVVLVVFSICTETYLFVIKGMHPLILNETSYLSRFIFYYSYFTVLSNLAVGLSCLILLVNADYSAKWFKVLRLDSILCITITCIVYNGMMRQWHDVDGMVILTNEFLHLIIPVLTIFSWLVYGPRQFIDQQVMSIAVIPPLIYVFYIFIRGYLTHIYPYHFLNADQLGLSKALWFIAAMIILFLLLEFILFLIDNKLTCGAEQRR